MQFQNVYCWFLKYGRLFVCLPTISFLLFDFPFIKKQEHLFKTPLMHLQLNITSIVAAKDALFNSWKIHFSTSVLLKKSAAHLQIKFLKCYPNSASILPLSVTQPFKSTCFRNPKCKESSNNNLFYYLLKMLIRTQTWIIVIWGGMPSTNKSTK